MLARLAVRNLKTDRFGTLCSILAVALGTATVNVVLTLDVNTRSRESAVWSTNPSLPVDLTRTVGLGAFRADGSPIGAADAKKETHEDYEVMRSAIRLGSLSAFLVGALIVFFTFAVVIERRRREIALLRSLGALPSQVAQIFVLEAAIVGALGAGAGLFLAIPLSIAAARAGITTTGRASLGWLWFPWKQMLLVAGIGGLTALLGVARPALHVAQLRVSEALRPRFLEERARRARRANSSGFTLITLPFMALLYLLMRPFFQQLLPSLAFFVLEAGLVCFAFLALLVLVPELVRALGSGIARLFPKGPAAARLLTLRRIEREGHELAWSVSGVMMVFALLLALHLSTRALKQEVVEWAEHAVRPYAFLYGRYRAVIPEALLEDLPAELVRARFSGRTEWPNSVYAVRREELIALVKTTGEPALIRLAERLVPGTIIVSEMMAKRYGVGPGDRIEINRGDGQRKLEVIAVSDRVGYVPMIGPYRNSKTYGLIEAGDFDLIADQAAPLGAAIALGDPRVAPRDRGTDHFDSILRRVPQRRGLFVQSGDRLEALRIQETNRDFFIFDVILFFTSVLAAVGVANQLVLSAHARRRELGLYRVLGMTGRQVQQLFLMEGAFIGVLGGALAALLGIPLGWAAVGALRMVSAFEVTFTVPPSYPVLVIGGAAVVALFAALYPARLAASARSAESVHYE